MTYFSDSFFFYFHGYHLNLILGAYLLPDKVGLELYESGHYSNALSHFEEAFIIKRKIYGVDNSDVACSLNNIGCAHYGGGSHMKWLISLKDALSFVKTWTNRFFSWKKTRSYVKLQRNWILDMLLFLPTTNLWL